MRIAFMGSPDFAIPALRTLAQGGHEIAAVYCQPARPAGRGQTVRRCPVHVAAAEMGLTVRTPARLRNDPDAQAAFAALRLDVAVVAAYGLLLPEAMLRAPALGCLNIHASLLPRWRGAAPIQAAILAGDTETGISIMQMEAGLDTGPGPSKQSIPITAETTAQSLHDALAALGARLIQDTLAAPSPAIPQSDADATYAPKLTREDGRIDWHQSASAIDRRIRALNPWPGTFTTLSGAPLKIVSALPVSGRGHPGSVLDHNLTVACATGAIKLTRLQLPGKSILDAAAFLRGHPIPPNTILGQ